MGKKKTPIYTIIALIAAAVIILTIAVVQSGIWTQEGENDALAKCLTEKGTTLYTTYWCPHCTDQKKLFGSSLKYLNLVECDPKGEDAQPELCTEKDVSSIPAWDFPDGTRETGTHTLEELAEKVDCPLPLSKTTES
jgi:hypothetical protein